MPSGFFYFNFLNGFFSYKRGVWFVFIIVMLVEISELNANCVDPDQTSDLGLYCLPMSLLWDARLKWV